MDTDNALLPESVINYRQKFGDYRDQFFPGVKIYSTLSKNIYTVKECPKSISFIAISALIKEGYKPVWVEEAFGWIDANRLIILETPNV